MTLLHPVAQLSWTQFTLHPSTVIGIAALGAAYAWRARRGPSASDRFPVTVVDAAHATAAQIDAAAARPGPTAGQRASFFASLALLFLTLNGPLHDLSGYFLFSAPMVQQFAFAPTKPDTNAIAKPPPATSVAMPCGVTPSRFHAFR